MTETKIIMIIKGTIPFNGITVIIIITKYCLRIQGDNNVLIRLRNTGRKSGFETRIKYLKKEKTYVKNNLFLPVALRLPFGARYFAQWL
jgi:hypothetical protein